MKHRIIALTLVALVFWTCTAAATFAQSTPPPFQPVTDQAELSNLSKMLNNTLTSTNASTATGTASASPSGGFLGLPGFEALYAVAGLLAVAYLVIRRRK